MRLITCSALNGSLEPLSSCGRLPRLSALQRRLTVGEDQRDQAQTSHSNYMNSFHDVSLPQDKIETAENPPSAESDTDLLSLCVCVMVCSQSESFASSFEVSGY